MAEARNAFAVGRQLHGGVKLNLDDDGVHFTIACTIPRWHLLRRWAVKAYHRTANYVVNNLYPWPPLLFVGVMAAIVAITVSADSSSWFRSGWIAEVVWQISLWFPWISGLSLHWRVGILAAYTTVILLMAILFLQRFLLRVILSWHGWLYAARKPTLAVKLWALAVKALSGRGGKALTYSYDSVIPNLPVPSLDATVKRYLASMRPVQDDDEYKKTEALAKKFLADEGPTLQRYLQLKRLFSSNYVSDWWTKYVYLKPRSALCINSNYYVLDGGVLPTSNQCARMGQILSNILAYRQLLQREEIPPMTIGPVPLCMQQYKLLFSTTRRPNVDCDSLEHYETSRHVVCMYKGSFYTVPCFRANGTALTARELEEQFLFIKAQVDALPAPDADEACIAALTGGDRSRWARVREEYMSSGVNFASYRAIETAITVCVLDDLEPENWTQQGQSLIHGDRGTNRWFDKSFCLMVYANGRFGMNVEHSWADAPVAAHMVEWTMLTSELNPGTYQDDGRTFPSVSASTKPAKPTRLVFDLNVDFRKAIAEATEEVRLLQADFQLRVVEFTEFGKNVPKKIGISPDGMCQLAIALAYYRETGKLTLTYESGMTRLFKLGRTETIRSCSIEAAAFIKSFEDPNCSREEKLKLIKASCEAHVNRSRDAMTGRGIDRHLFGLYVVSVGKNIESPFLKDALSHPWVLSTSQQPQHQTGNRWNPRDPEMQPRQSPGGGFGAVHKQGYGISYMTLEHKLCFHVSAYASSEATDAHKFADRIQQALRDIRSTFITE